MSNYRDCKTPPPLPKKTTTAAADEGTSLPIYSARYSPPTKGKVYHYGRYVPEYHPPLAPVPTIPSPSAVTWPGVYIPGSPELPPGLSHEMEWELAYIDHYWQKEEHKEEKEEKQNKEPKMPYWALSTVGGRGSATLRSPTASQELAGLQDREEASTSTKAEPQRDSSEEDLGDMGAFSEPPGSLPDLIPPVPTQERRPSLEAAVIDKMSPSVAEAHPLHIHDLVQHHSEKTPTDEPSTSEPPALTESQSSDQSPGTSAPDVDSLEGDLDATFAQLLSMGFDAKMCELAISHSLSDRETVNTSLGSGRSSLLDAAVGWLIAKQGEGEEHVRGITCEYSEFD
ncbi:hypothetical protein SpCBS45565_g07111 [Spizellomyces sp. 'palustris']|nr:hypothetical protein SpCBS45565_g07111 [Spizellomyces sp. 'palustris']